MATVIERLAVNVTANYRGLTKGLRASQRQVEKFGRSMERAGRRFFFAGAAMLAPIAKSVHTYAAFSDKMAEVGAVSQSTGRALEALTDEAARLGRTTSFTAIQVAGGMAELGRAGFKAGQIIQSTRHILDLARATNTGLAESSEIAAMAMRGFGLSTAETERIADVLVSTANNSAQTITDIGESLKMVAPLASAANETIEDTAAALGVLANNGIKGTRAGTALARAYKNIAAGKGAADLKRLGVSIEDSNGNLLKMSDILNEIGKATAGMGTAQKLSIFETLFGRGQAAALKLAGGTFKGMRDELDGIKGAARRTAAVMDGTLAGSFRLLKSAIEGTQIAIGRALEPTIRAVTGKMLGWVASITDWVRANNAAIVAYTKIAVAIMAVGAALLLVAGAAKVVAILLSPVGIMAIAALGVLTLLDAVGAVNLGWVDLVNNIRIGGAKIGTHMTAVVLIMTQAWNTGLAAMDTQWKTLLSIMTDDNSKITVKSAFTGIATIMTDVFLQQFKIIARGFEKLLGFIPGAGGAEVKARKFANKIQAMQEKAWRDLYADKPTNAQHLVDTTEQIAKDLEAKNKALMDALTEIYAADIRDYTPTEKKGWLDKLLKGLGVDLGLSAGGGDMDTGYSGAFQTPAALERGSAGAFSAVAQADYRHRNAQLVEMKKTNDLLADIKARLNLPGLDDFDVGGID